MTTFEVNSTDDSCFFMAGSKLLKCENKKLEEVCDTSFNVHKSENYLVAKDAKSDSYHVYNYRTKTLTSENFSFTPQSIYKTDKNTFCIGTDKKLYNIVNEEVIKAVPLVFDKEAKIVSVNETEVRVVLAARNNMDYLETMFCIYDYSLNQLAKNLFVQKDTDDFHVRDYHFCKSDDGKTRYALISYSGGSKPIVLKKVGDTKYIQPHLKSLMLPGLSSFNDMCVENDMIYFGTGRKIFSMQLTEKEQAAAKQDAVKATKETNLIIEAMYLDQVSRIKRVDKIEVKEFGQDVLLSRVIVNPAKTDQLYIAKNSKDNKTNILRFNFQTETSVEVVKEVEKLDVESFMADIVVNQENLINGVDSNGYYYSEGTGDKMFITDLMTYSRKSMFNLTRSRQIAVNASRTMGYLVADDGDSVIEIDLLDHNKFRGLHGNLYGTLEVKVVGDKTMFGVKKIINKQGRTEYTIYKYDIAAQTVIEEGNLALPANYHVEALRAVEDKHLLVVANKRDDKDSKSGKSGEVIFALYNPNLERVFMSSDTPIGNKFGVSNVIEVLTVLKGLPIIVISKEATLYVFAIESDSRIKQIDTINFSNADGPGSKIRITLGTIESACVVGNLLYVVRNRNSLHRIKFEGL